MIRLLVVPVVCVVLFVALVLILADRSDDTAPVRVRTTSATTVPPLEPASTTGPGETFPPRPKVRLIPKARTAPSGVWDRLRRCECPAGWHCNTGNGYFGGLQMDPPFWRTYGGLRLAARPDLATREQQIEVAERGRAARGFTPWPTCARRLGLL